MQFISYEKSYRILCVKQRLLMAFENIGVLVCSVLKKLRSLGAVISTACTAILSLDERVRCPPRETREFTPRALVAQNKVASTHPGLHCNS
jgi:hypothetical protein